MVSTELALAEPDVSGRGRILRAARSLFTSHGYATVSMQQIADAAGVNKATLYHHFHDKEDLFVSVMTEEFARTAVDIDAALAGGGTLRDQLARVAAHLFVVRQSDFGRLSADMRDHVSDSRRADLFSRCSPPWEQVQAAIERAARKGEVRDIDADLMARLFFAMVGSQVWWTKFAVGRPPPDAELAATIADVLLDGIGGRPRGGA